MARFRTEGLDKLIEDLDRMGETTGELAEELLFVGAEMVKRGWKRAAQIHNLRLTSQMYNSIDYSRKPHKAGDILSVEIYPQGKSTYTEDPKTGKRYKRTKPVRNAEVAYINHYGTSKKSGTHWVDTADDLSAPDVESACLRTYDDWLAKHGMK